MRFSILHLHKMGFIVLALQAHLTAGTWCNYQLNSTWALNNTKFTVTCPLSFLSNSFSVMCQNWEEFTVLINFSGQKNLQLQIVNVPLHTMYTESIRHFIIYFGVYPENVVHY